MSVEVILKDVLWLAVVIALSSIFTVFSRHNRIKALRIATRLLALSGFLTILWAVMFVSYRILRYFGFC
ncbi:MAG: hypothetical protein F7B59_03680 [Desulfurococcales archaeon]|nr:hypothetical protein [Desulfurococcales archaeon]